jgi:hypothetical protein
VQGQQNGAHIGYDPAGRLPTGFWRSGENTLLGGTNGTAGAPVSKKDCDLPPDARAKTWRGLPAIERGRLIRWRIKRSRRWHVCRARCVAKCIGRIGAGANRAILRGRSPAWSCPSYGRQHGGGLGESVSKTLFRLGTPAAAAESRINSLCQSAPVGSAL